MQPAGTGQTRLECRVENTLAVAERLLHVRQSETLQEILRRHARPAGEQSMEMKGA